MRRRAFLLASLGAAASRAEPKRVIAAGREAEVLALFAPYELGREVDGGYKLWNVRIEADRIEVELSHESQGLARLTLRQRAAGGGEREASASFGLERDASAGSGSAKHAADLLFARVTANDRGGFFRQAERPARDAAAPHSPFRGVLVPIGVFVLTLLAMLATRRFKGPSASGREPPSA